MVTHKEKCYYILEGVIPIHVGAFFNIDYLEEFKDNVGDNISHKNKVYCELTAIYWIWRNIYNYEYLGICHYRRIFDLNYHECINYMKSYDMIVPKVKNFRMSIEEQYIKEHGDFEWKTMLEVLKEIYVNDYDKLLSILQNNKLYCYNMFITNKNEFYKYCKWIFPILFKIEKRIGNNIRNTYQNRYIGFLAERLLTVYIIYNNINVIEVDIKFTEKRKQHINYFKQHINDKIFMISKFIRN